MIEILTLLNQPEQVLVGIGTEVGLCIYVIIFLIVFFENGFVIAAPFFPGDTFLFVCGMLIGTGFLDMALVLVAISLAAIVGYMVNYYTGRYAGITYLTSPAAGFVKPEWVQRTESFFSLYGGYTIVIGRFIPYIRSLTPFIAGVADMKSGRFLLYNITGGIFWTCTIVYLGFILGRSSFIQEYSQLFLWLMILSLLAGVVVAVCAAFLSIRQRICLKRT